ncbi:ATP-binding protein [Methylobacterium sp. Leaf466]|uniref:ATP-binding protein n=1 Tax=Methylobacterium sp. Leaf466 TaxID=1736386 RepID=UPI0009E69DF8|nr:ATP-binding protein [Methylobacterium sp. Leaf466]
MRRPTLSAGFKAAAVVVGIGIPAVVANHLHQQYGQALHIAETSTANTTRALEQHAARTLETVDTYLQAVISVIGPDMDGLSPEVIHKALRDRLAQSRHLNNVMILDASGRLIHEAGAFPARSTEFGDRDYVEALHGDGQTGLVVGRPVTGRVSKLPTLPLIRRITRADGSFAGMVVASLNPAAFQEVYDALDLGAGSTLSLWRADGTLLVRSPDLPSAVGKNYAATENYKRYVLARQTRPFWSAGSTDGIERVLALGFVPSYPLYVSATQSRDTALAEWRRSVWTQAPIAGGTTLVLVLSLLSLASEIGRRQRSDAQTRQAERSARITSATLRNTLDTMEQGLIETDARGVVQVCNRRARDLLGITDAMMARAPVLGRDLEGHLRHGEADPADPQARRFPDEGDVARCAAVFERECRDGTVLEVRTVALPEGGAVRTYTDITPRRRSDRAFKESEARYRLLAQTATDMIVLSGIDGVRHYVSPASVDLLGYGPEELVGAHPEAMVHPEDAARLGEILTALREGRIDQGVSTHRFRRKDGSFTWVESKYRLIRDPATGAPASMMVAVRDVSERHERQEELRAAKEAAEAAAAAKGEFLASMSHELRTPLNSIIGFSGLMLDSPDLRTPMLRRYARLVQDASTTLLSIVNDVLDVSKLEAGSLALDPQPFSPHDLVEGAVALLRNEADAKGLALTAQVEAGVPERLVGDDARLRQVLLNLLSNAVKFTAAGRVHLHVATEEGGERARIRFTVTDTGIGIPQEKRHRLFQRFSQVDGSTARRYGGTGLGLSICRSLVEMMGGTIDLDSAEGEGSRFSFAIALPVAATPAVEGAADADARAGTAVGRCAHILLAEDVDMNRELAVTLLSGWGHRVDVVLDGAAAVEAVTRVAYDLVLMDVQMPVMDGLEATRRIRGLGGAFARLPILAMTANVMTDDVARCREAGMDDHIGKPFAPARLRAAVAHWAGPSVRGPDAGVPTQDDRDEAPAPGHDPAILDELHDLLGPASLGQMLARFASELDRRFAAPVRDAADWPAVGGDAHALVSSAGLLGFGRLSDACRTMEQVCTGPDRDEARSRLQLDRVREEIAWVRRALPVITARRAA